jgi:hypothetical protein
MRDGGGRSGPKDERQDASDELRKLSEGTLREGGSAAIGPLAGRSGAVAQMGERCNRTAEVRGSIPLSSTSPGANKINELVNVPDRRSGHFRLLGIALVSQSILLGPQGL